MGEIPLDKMGELVNSNIKYDLKGLMAQQKPAEADPAPKPQE
jgi:hypothetical protein